MSKVDPDVSISSCPVPGVVRANQMDRWLPDVWFGSPLSVDALVFSAVVVPDPLELMRFASANMS